VIKQSAEGEGTQTSMSEKSSDQSAVDEPAIAGPDTQASQLPSTSTPDSTSLDGNSNPTNLITTHKKTNNCPTFTETQHNSPQMHDTETKEV